MRFFSPDGKLYQFIARLWDIIVLNFCWFITGGLPAVLGFFLAQLSGMNGFYAICLISLITFGPATISACSILLKMVDDTEGYMFKPFFRGFKENFRQGVPMGAFAILVFLAAYTELYVLSHQMGIVAFFVLGVFTLVIGMVMLPLAFPLAARYENRVMNHLRNAFRISMKFFGRTLLMWLVLLFEIVLFLWNAKTQTVGLFVGPMVVMFTVCGFALPMFRKLEADGGSVAQK